jgi:DNA-binding CsgD family transcriptional regulator
MPGFTLTSRETALLRDIVDATRVNADVPLPWSVLEQLKALLNADCVSFLCLDSQVPRVVFEQFIEPWDVHGVETETAGEAQHNPFWLEYWGTHGCNYPDLSGDYRFVRRASDHSSLRERRNKLAARGDTDPVSERYLEACLPGRSPGRYLRVGAYRAGRDFTEREVFLLRILQPHIEQAFWSGAASHSGLSLLTTRQLEVMRMVRAGLTNREIARRLSVSERTVHMHLYNVYRRLGVQTRAAAVHRVFDLAEDWAQWSPLTGEADDSLRVYDQRAHTNYATT